MSLRRTAVLIVCVTFCGLFAVLYAISQSNIQVSFNYLEREEVEEELTRGLKALEGELSALDATTADWAVWDDTYRYLQDHNEDFLRANITVDSLQTIHVGLILLYDRQNQLVFGRILDAATGTLAAVSPVLADRVAASPLLHRPGNTDAPLSGLVLVSGETWLLSACPVLTSQRTGPPHGTLVLGRRLDAAKLEALSGAVMLDLDVANLQTEGLSPRLKDVTAALLRTEQPQIVPEGPDRIQGFALLRDVANKPALLLSVTLPRRIHQQSRLTQRNNFLFLLVIGMTFGLAMLYLVERRILSRVTSLSRQIDRLGEQPGALRQTFIAGNDEIAGLSKAVNGMLAALEHSHSRYAMATRAAKVGVWEYRKDTNAYYVDPSFQELLGYSDGTGQIGLEAWMERVHPEDRERVREALTACLDGERDEYVGEQRMLAKDGSPRWVLVRGRAVRDAAGRRTLFVGTNMDVTDLKRAEESIRELTGALITAQEDERARIARDLHDNVAQCLSAAKIAGETLHDGALLSTPELKARLTEFSSLISRAIWSVREISYDLRPPDLEYLGLPQALERLCDDFSRATGIRVVFSGAGLDGVVLGQDVAINLYRIVQEALANVRRHAKARQVSVRLVESFPKIIVRIKDDGQGFDVATQQEQAGRHRHMGLASMRERAGLFGGTLRIVSAPGQGCLVVAEVLYVDAKDLDHETHSDR